MDFGKALKQIRTERQLSLQQMADILGTSRQVLSRYEQNQRTPKLTTVLEYAQKLQIPPSSLIKEIIPQGFLESYDSFEEAQRAWEAAQWSQMMDEWTPFDVDESRLLQAYRAADPIYKTVALEILVGHPATTNDKNA